MSTTSVPSKDDLISRAMDIERLEMAMDVAVDGIWDWRLDKDEVYFDLRYYSMAGYEPSE